MKYCIGLLIAALPILSNAQALSRRSFLGTSLEDVTGDVKSLMELPDTSGVLINKVFKGSTAEAIKLQKGDVLLKINNTPINNPQDAVNYVGGQKSGEKFSYEIYRNKKTVKGKGTFKPYPQESYRDLDVQYTQVKTGAGLQRAIITQVKTGVANPTVVFIGGIGCYSLDSPFDTARSEIQVLNLLARAGFTAIRIEKPGIGDGAGHSTPCNEIGFHDEVAGYASAIEELKQKQKIATNQPVYVIGHSMGGVMAPMIAEQTKIDGIIAYGTLGSNFIEYLAKTRRTIGEAYEWSQEETDKYIKDCIECTSYYFYGRESAEAAALKNPECREHLSVFDLRSRKYNDELFALNIPAIWKNYSGKSLIAWGSSDFIASETDHQIIAKTIEQYHKNNGTLLTIINTDHGMNTANSFQQALTNPGTYNTEVGTSFLKWLKKQAS